MTERGAALSLVKVWQFRPVVIIHAVHLALIDDRFFCYVAASNKNVFVVARDRAAKR